MLFTAHQVLLEALLLVPLAFLLDALVSGIVGAACTNSSCTGVLLGLWRSCGLRRCLWHGGRRAGQDFGQRIEPRFQLGGTERVLLAFVS